MEQKESEILLKDLSGRLPYGVIVKLVNSEVPEKLLRIDCEDEYSCVSTKRGVYYPEDVKPYLRPLSSMTEKEKKEFLNADMDDLKICCEAMQKKLQMDSNEETVYAMYHHVDWLDKYMFDYRGLIPMGLALEAPEGMYQMEE